MKRLFISLFLSFVLVIGLVSAQGLESTDSGKIEEIKKRVSQKIESLQIKAVDVVSGFLKGVKGNVFSLDSEGEIKDVIIDEEITAFYDVTKGTLKTIKREDIKESDYLVAFGNILDEEFQAISVFKEQPVGLVSGTVVDIDTSTSVINVVDEQGEDYELDISRGTIIYMVDEKDDKINLLRITLSRVKKDDKIVFSYEMSNESGDKNAKEKQIKEVSPKRLVIIPQELLEKLRAEKSK